MSDSLAAAGRTSSPLSCRTFTSAFLVSGLTFSFARISSSVGLGGGISPASGASAGGSGLAGARSTGSSSAAASLAAVRSTGSSSAAASVGAAASAGVVASGVSLLSDSATDSSVFWRGFRASLVSGASWSLSRISDRDGLAGGSWMSSVISGTSGSGVSSGSGAGGTVLGATFWRSSGIPSSWVRVAL